MQPITQPFATDTHDFTIEWQGNKATIVCQGSDQYEVLENPVTNSEFKEMILSACIKGIKKVDVNINYSIEIQRYQWSEIAKKYQIKLTRISN